MRSVASLGVVISASHNAYPTTVSKFLVPKGTKLPDAWELDVEAALDEAPVWADSSSLGKARRLDDAAGRYIEFCKARFLKTSPSRASKLWWMPRMAAYQVAPKVFHELGAG